MRAANAMRVFSGITSTGPIARALAITRSTISTIAGARPSR
jgi:hypothetical protein